MPSGAEELMMDSPLSTFDFERDEEYEDLFGTQISPDMADLEVPSNDNMLLEAQQLDDVVAQTPNNQSSSLCDGLRHQAPKTAGVQSFEPHNVIDVEGFSSDIGDVPVATRIKDEFDTAEHQHHDSIIKQEDTVSPMDTLPRFRANDVIDLCESDDDQYVSDEVQNIHRGIKAEENDQPFQWTDMGNDIVDVSDSKEEELPLKLRSEQVLSKSAASTSTMNSIQSQTMQSSISPPDPGSGNGAHEQRQSSDHSSHRNANVTGAGGLFRGFQGRASTRQSTPEVCDANSEDSSDESVDFQELKRKYKSKKRNGKNTMEDDIAFMTAKDKEELRVKRIDADQLLRDRALIQGEDIPAEDLDSSLFVSQCPSSRKRRLAATVDTEASDYDAIEHLEKKSRITKRADNEKPKKRRNLKGLWTEEEMAKQTGYEAYLECANGEPDNEAENQKGRKTKRKGLSKSKKPQPKASKSRSSKSKDLSNIGSLGSSNVFGAAASNANKPALEVENAKTKDMAFTALLAAVPLESRREAKFDIADIKKASKGLGFRMCTTDGKGGHKLKGMASSLRDHQVLAADFMVKREAGTRQPRGGLLADEMGLGKTVEVIATMVANPPADGDEIRCTLIVAPSGLVNQWMDELEKHCEPERFKRVWRYDATSRMQGQGCVYVMQEADVVFTSYQEVVSSWPKVPEGGKGDEAEKLWAEAWNNGRGPLHKVHFHRVVLDEAHIIKNHRSQTSLACRGLMAKHKWAVTGTPILNRVEEFYAYFKFLQIKETGPLKIFKSNFCNPEDKACTRRLHAMLRQFMIRRTHSDTLMGAPIVKLPPIHQATLSRKGELEQSANLIHIMILRLRQLTAHPFLLQSVLEDFFEVGDVEKLWNRTKSKESEHESCHAMIVAMENLVKAKALASAYAKEPAENDSVGDGINGDIEADDYTVKNYRHHLKGLKTRSLWTDLKEREFCHKCKFPPEEPWITSCLHVYCRDCLDAMAHDAAENGKASAECLECSNRFTFSKPGDGIKELNLDDISISSTSENKKKPTKKSLDEQMKWVDIGGKILPSSKTQAVQMQLEAWISQDPGKKIIIFSQFHLLMLIVGRVCEENGWGYCHYNGRMTMDARHKAIGTFRDNPETQIMIASLKCGGIGLNLTMASKVICVDLWWNSSVEQQAFCRVFRIGQTSETCVSRFVVKDTIDEILENIQIDKDQAITEALDSNSKKLGAFTVKELMELFGTVQQDENGNSFILVDDEKDPQPDEPEPPKPRDTC